jgi:hypothetical protein
MEMLSGVAALRRVTAAHVATNHAKTEVQPIVACFQALFTCPSVWHHPVDLIEMFTFSHAATLHHVATTIGEQLDAPSECEDSAEPHVLEEGTDGVRIMTVRTAKFNPRNMAIWPKDIVAECFR